MLVRTPAKVLDHPDQSRVLFEFEVEDADTESVDTATESNSSSAAAAVATTPRLSYLVSGPGASDSWAAVPAVPRAEWQELLTLAGESNGTSSSSSFSSSGQGGGGGAEGEFVWGLELEGLDDGEYRLQVTVGWSGQGDGVLLIERVCGGVCGAGTDGGHFAGGQLVVYGHLRPCD